MKLCVLALDYDGTIAAARRSRVSELNTTLETRRRELLDEVHVKLRDADR